MPLESDLKLDYTKFDPKSITPRTQQVNDAAIRMMKGGPRWYQVGAEKYRQMRWNGETPLPKPVVIESGKNTSVPSREKGRSIPCRAFVPSSGAAKGVFYHIHGGGWVLQSELFQDAYLKWLADECQLAVLSVGYRLAPEDPYPAGNEDCFDVGEWLVDHAEEAYGGPLLFMGGDSAGAHLSAVTAFHLLKSRPRFAFKGLVLNFGAYDLSGFLPQMHHFDVPLILDLDIMDKYCFAFHRFGEDSLRMLTFLQIRRGVLSQYNDLAKTRPLDLAILCGSDQDETATGAVHCWHDGLLVR